MIAVIPGAGNTLHSRYLKPVIAGFVALMLANIQPPAAAADDTGHGWFDPHTGNDLLMLCQADEATSLRGICAGFILGVINGVSFEKDTTHQACVWDIPRGTTGDKLINIVVGDLNAHPETRPQSAFFLIMKSVERAFPCH